MMYLIDTLNADKSFFDLIMQRFIGHCLKKQFTGHPQITNNIKQDE